MALLQFYHAWSELPLYWSMLHDFMASRKVTTPGCVANRIPFFVSLHASIGHRSEAIKHNSGATFFCYIPLTHWKPAVSLEYEYEHAFSVSRSGNTAVTVGYCSLRYLYVSLVNPRISWKHRLGAEQVFDQTGARPAYVPLISLHTDGLKYQPSKQEQRVAAGSGTQSASRQTSYNLISFSIP